MAKQGLLYDSENNIYLDLTTKKADTDKTDLELIKMFDELQMTDREVELFKVARHAAHGECESRLHGVAAVLDALLNRHGDKENTEQWVRGLLDAAAETCPITADRIKEGALSLCESEQDARSVVLATLVNTQWELRMFDILSSVLASILTEHKDREAFQTAFLNGEI